MVRVSSRLLAGGLILLPQLPCGAQAPSPDAERRDEKPPCMFLPLLPCAQGPTFSAAGEVPPDEPVYRSLPIIAPQLLSGREVRYTPEALAARVQGVAVAQCTITAQGTVEGCHMLKSLPYLDQAVIEALESRRYRPALQGGKPISVSYAISLKLALP